MIPQIGIRLAVSKKYRDRYREIVSALLRHGFGFLVTQLGLARYVPFQIGLLRRARRVEPYTQAEHVRFMFEELGTTFIKLGQVLSTRVDLIPPEYIHELEKLLDRVPPTDFVLIREAVERALDKSLDNVFDYFEPVPLASASIGQVHAARLKSGEDVVVKIKRPGVQTQVNTDVEIITELARLASRRIPALRDYDLQGITREFTQTLLKELDYIQEGRNADRFRSNFRGDERVYIPEVYWDYTTDDVIMMERIYGVRINDKEALLSKGIDPRAVAKRSADILLEQVFEHGFFHADPHPANFFVFADGSIGMVDFGMVGYIDQLTKGNLVELFIAIFQQDPDRVVDAYVDLGIAGRVERFGELRSEIGTLIMKYYGLTLRQVNIRNVLNDVTAVIRRHRLRMPANLALLVKTVSMEESLVLQLDPDFNFAQEMAPLARRVWEETRSPVALARRSLRALSDLADVGLGAPRQVRRILGQLSRGEFSIITNQPRLDEELTYIGAIVNRLIVAILTAAVLISSGLLLSFFRERRRKEEGF